MGNRGYRTRFVWGVLIAIAGMGILTACGGRSSAPDPEGELLAWMPAEAPMRITVASMEKVLSGLDSLIDETGEAGFDDLYRRILAGIEGGASSVPSPREEWQAAGFDLNRPIGFTLLSMDPEGGYAFFPLEDADRFLGHEWWVPESTPFEIAVQGESVPSGYMRDTWWFLANEYAVAATSEEFAHIAAGMMENPVTVTLDAREAEAMTGAEVALLMTQDFAGLLSNPLSRSRHAAQRASSSNNLKQMGLVFKMFANESRGERWPALSPEAGELMASPRAIYPEYLTDLTILSNPQAGDAMEWSDSLQAGIPGDGTIDHHYFYLGYLIRDIAQMEGFARAYLQHAADGEVPTNDLEADDQNIHTLREGIERLYIEDIRDPAGSSRVQATIPVMIERPVDAMGEDVQVLFMDGSVRAIPYGEFPNTERFWSALVEIKRAFDPNYTLVLERGVADEPESLDFAESNPFTRLLLTIHLRSADGGLAQVIASKKEASEQVPEPLSSMHLLPDDAGLSLAFRVDHEYLKMLSGEESDASPYFPAGMAEMGAFFESLFHGEAAAAITMGEAGIPRIQIMIELSQPEVVDMMLAMGGIETQLLGEHDGVRIRALGGMVPMLGTICFAVDGNRLFGATGEQVLHELLDRRASAPSTSRTPSANRIVLHLNPAELTRGPFVQMMTGMMGADPDLQAMVNAFRTAPAVSIHTQEESEFLITNIHGLPRLMTHFGRILADRFADDLSKARAF